MIKEWRMKLKLKVNLKFNMIYFKNTFYSYEREKSLKINFDGKNEI